MAQMVYGEGNMVNIEHRRAVNRLAKGFRPTARALDGTIDAYESEIANWVVMGVHWQPACSMSSGLDIQLFRALIDAAKKATGASVATKSTAKPG
jgi:gamma-glutamyl-gamma-aminobutyrate hydrolase PuuD